MILKEITIWTICCTVCYRNNGDLTISIRKQQQIDDYAMNGVDYHGMS